VVGIVVVSHSRALARAAVALAAEMTPGTTVAIAIAAGLDDDTFGTDAVAVQQAIEQVDSPDGVVVFCDLGSAVLSAEMALEFLTDDVRDRVRISSAALVEGLVAACVTAAGGGSAAEVVAEAARGLDAKATQLGDSATPAAAPPIEDVGGATATATFVVATPHGLHARPAARLVSTVRGFDARVVLSNLDSGAGPISAASLSAVATLGARQGNRIELTASGPDADRVRDAVLALAARDFDESAAQPPTSALTSDGGPVGAAPGVAIGPASQLAAAVPPIPAQEPGAPDVQRRRLVEAIEATRAEIDTTRRRVSTAAGDADAAIFEAHALLLDDPALLDDVWARIDAGTGAARAFDDAIAAATAALAELADSYQRGRAADVRGVGDQVLRHLLVGSAAPARKLAGIVVAADLTPAQAADLDRGTVQAVVLAGGSSTSHAAILARAYGIPMVTGAGTQLLAVPEGTTIAVDGELGEVVVDPSADVLARYRARAAGREATQATARAAAGQPAVTSDGIQIGVLANVGSLDDAVAAAAAHADGSGLVRTEFLFAGRATRPDRDEQEQAYRAIAEALGGSRVVLRTLDVGGDKPMPFLPQATEANPFLGERGIRLTLHHPDLFLDQLVAMCRVARDHPISVMFPMVSDVSEVLAAREILDTAIAEVGGRPAELRIGIMVEVPGVALKASSFVPHVDFFSVGTNDLTQYALAAERGNASVAGLSDGLDPGVLRLMAILCADAGETPVSVCGELAADPLAVPLLLGLGVRSLSVAPPFVAAVKQQVRSIELAAATPLAERALACGSAGDVRALARGSLS
jgi:phosphoenolpyruvate-protein phosphotransferase/dihydroxyacetone kinase phosphotransfer subunit